MSRPRTPLGDRLAAHLRFDADTGCQVWTGFIGKSGYGTINAGPPTYARVRAHRVSYELAVGPIPAGLHLDHLCRNRACCNPAHLEAVTAAENIRRGDGIAAVNARRTHCKRGHAFSPENTYQNAGRRLCRACRSARSSLAWKCRDEGNLSPDELLNPPGGEL